VRQAGDRAGAGGIAGSDQNARDQRRRILQREFRDPFENPTPLTNFVEMLMIFAIPTGLAYTFGHIVGDRRQGWTIFGAFSVMFLIGIFACYWAEQNGKPNFAKLGIANQATATQTGGNMEGKETRFGNCGFGSVYDRYDGRKLRGGKQCA
jgi:K+-transporting ATPase A subunit